MPTYYIFLYPRETAAGSSSSLSKLSLINNYSLKDVTSESLRVSLDAC